jgi:hypothetical protein
MAAPGSTMAEKKHKLATLFTGEFFLGDLF